jgi:hypothetical protein
LHAELAGDVVDARELGLALDVEAVRSPCSSASLISASVLPTPANTLRAHAAAGGEDALISPPLTRSKAAPRFAKWRRTARLEFAFIA